MGDAGHTGRGRGAGPLGSGWGEEHWRGGADERWLEHKLRDFYRGVLDEPLPKELLDIVDRIPDPTSEARARGHRWRAKAEELRKVAESATSDTARRALLLMARDYDALTEHAEREARQQDEQVLD